MLSNVATNTGLSLQREPLPGYFKKKGLRLTKLDQQQDEFMCSYGRLFTVCEKNHMRKAWHQYFRVEKNNIGRENIIWFCLTKATYESDGVEPILKLFGGEAIHKPLQRNKTICSKLQKIGSPVIVEVLLPPNSINLAGSPAKTLLNAWHRTIRHDVDPLEAETFVHCPIAPSEILNVWAR